MQWPSRLFELRRRARSEWNHIATAVREAFLLALPAIVAINLLEVLFVLLIWVWPTESFEHAATAVSAVPLAYVCVVALADVLARRHGVPRIAAVLTVLVALTGVARLYGIPLLNTAPVAGPLVPLLLLSIPMAFLTVGLMGRFTRRFATSPKGSAAQLSPVVLTMTRAIPAAALTLPCVLLIGGAAALGLHAMLDAVNLPQHRSFDGDGLQLAVYTIMVQTLWFVGLHGANIAESLMPQIANGPSAGVLRAVFNGFLHLGGTGSTLGLIGAVLLANGRSALRSVCRLALPFAFFNINEVLIFGVPIVFNPVLLLPFVLAPLLNAALVLAALHFGLFSIVETHLSWATPPLLSAWLASGGSPVAVLVQLLCLLLDVLVYLPFVRRRSRTRNRADTLDKLFSGVAARRYVAGRIDDRSKEQFLRQQAAAREAEDSKRAALQLLEGGNFILFYQPKINCATGRVCGGEALLRLLDAEGRIHPPTFLPALYRLGLSKAIDDKVVELFFDQLMQWRREGFEPPRISINLDRDFLLDPICITSLIERARHHPGCVETEITEHNFMHAASGLSEAVQRLRAARVRVSLDDFGSGYSSLARLSLLYGDEVKLDRALIVPIETPRGAALVEHIVSLCHHLGYEVLAEGVETPIQMDILKIANVDAIQGYLTGRPMDAHTFKSTVLGN